MNVQLSAQHNANSEVLDAGTFLTGVPGQPTKQKILIPVRPCHLRRKRRRWATFKRHAEGSLSHQSKNKNLKKIK